MRRPPSSSPEPTVTVVRAGKSRHSRFASSPAKEMRQQVSQKIEKDKGGLNDVAPPPTDLLELGQLMLKNTWNSSCIHAKVGNLIGDGWRLSPTKKHVDEIKELEARQKELEGSEERTPEEEQELRDVLAILARYQDIEEEITKFFKKPNRKMTCTGIAKNAFTDCEGIGQGFWEVSVNGFTAKPDHFFHVPAVTMKKLRVQEGWVQTRIDGSKVFLKEWGDWGIYDKNTGKKHGAFVTNEEGEVIRGAQDMAPIIWEEGQEPLPLEKWANAVVVFQKYNPMDPWYGLPDGFPAVSAMAGKTAADEFNWQEFANLGMARWAMVVSGAPLTADARKEVETFFEEDLNENAHGVILIHIPKPPPSPVAGAPAPEPTTVTFTKLDTEQHEGHFQDYRHDLRDEVLAAHNVPPALVSIIETGNIGGGQGTTQMANFVKNVINPIKTEREYQINRLIEEGFQVAWLVFSFNTSDLTGELDQARISQIYGDVYAMTINEMRKRAGLDPVNGGDRIFLVIPGIGLIFVDDLDEMESMFLPGGQTPSVAPTGEPSAPEEDPVPEPEPEAAVAQVIKKFIQAAQRQQETSAVIEPVRTHQ